MIGICLFIRLIIVFRMCFFLFVVKVGFLVVVLLMMIVWVLFFSKKLMCVFKVLILILLFVKGVVSVMLIFLNKCVILICFF